MGRLLGGLLCLFVGGSWLCMVLVFVWSCCSLIRRLLCCSLYFCGTCSFMLFVWVVSWCISSSSDSMVLFDKLVLYIMFLGAVCTGVFILLLVYCCV